MLAKSKLYAVGLWKWFRKLPVAIQVLLIVPIGTAILLSTLVGNMGLAVLGSAYAINAFLTGWVGGILLLFLGKAGSILAKEFRRKR